MKVGKYFVAVAAVVMSFIFSTTAYAHDSLYSMTHKVADTKWDIFEGSTSPNRHSSGHGIYVKCHSSLADYGAFSDIEDCVTGAINAWSSAQFNKTYPIKISRVDDTYKLSSVDTNNEKTLVMICAVSDTSGQYWAQTMLYGSKTTCYTATDSGQHLKTIRINLNAATLGDGSKTRTNIQYTLTHELGHVIGLKDLSSDFDDSSFKECLMGYQNWSMTKPSVYDVNGAAVISGKHNTHNQYYYKSRNATYHEKHCGLCDGYVLEKHTASGGKCIYCNRTLS